MPDLDPNAELPTPQPLRAEIDVFIGSTELAKFSIEHGEYLIGRDLSCPIFVDAENVSRHHARLTFSAFELVIEDLSSSNGIFIDGFRLQIPTRIRVGQEIQIGQAKLIVRLQHSSAQQLANALWDKDLGLADVRKLIEGPKYKVITTINHGGMGVILQSRDLRLRRTVAIKVINSQNQFSRENALRFIEEAQLTGQLEHPNIIPIYELGTDPQGEMFYSMKFVKGTTLHEIIHLLRHSHPETLKKYPLTSLLTIFQKVCDAVAYAHSKGVVHRDLKPENIMIGSFGEVLVMDWGLAKNITAGHPSPPTPPPHLDPAIPHSPPDALRGFQTLHGLIVGTPPYISPEQARGDLDQVNELSDLFVLGEILYTILTLRTPFDDPSLQSILENILAHQLPHPSSYNQPPPSTKNSPPPPNSYPLAHCPGQRIPDGLSAVTMKALALHPHDRYPSVKDFQEDLAACQSGFAPKAQRARLPKQIALFIRRHRTESALFLIFFLLFNALIITFIFHLSQARDHAQASERAALKSERIAATRLAELRGTAPTFFDQASDLIQNQRFPEALAKINYAIEQVPNEAAYHNLRGNILQAELRLEEAADAHEEALRLNPQLATAKLNLNLDRQLLAQITDPSAPIPPSLRSQLATALLAQGRPTAAAHLSPSSPIPSPIPSPKRSPTEHRPSSQNPRLSTLADGSQRAEFPPNSTPNLKKLRNLNISELILDSTILSDLSDLRSLPIRFLSIRNSPPLDLSPLSSLPLEILILEGPNPHPNLNLLPLAKISSLRSLILPTPLPDCSPLRKLPNLSHISQKSAPKSALQFWKEYPSSTPSPP